MPVNPPNGRQRIAGGRFTKLLTSYGSGMIFSEDSTATMPVDAD